MLLSKELNDIKKKLKLKSIDVNLLKFYQNPCGNSMNEFHEDIKTIFELKKNLRKFINGRKVLYTSIYNIYTTLKNVFSVDGICYIGITYFKEDEMLFECFSALLWFFDNIRLSNQRSKTFIEFLKKERKTMN